MDHCSQLGAERIHSSIRAPLRGLNEKSSKTGLIHNCSKLFISRTYWYAVSITRSMRAYRLRLDGIAVLSSQKLELYHGKREQ